LDFTKWLIEYFRVAPSLYFEARLRAKPSM